MIYPTSDYIRRAYDRADQGLRATGYLGDINLSGILTKLIQDTGRFVEHYASDLFITWEHAIALTDKHEVTPDEDSIIVFGMRECGVDHNAYFMSRTYSQESKSTYRKIYALRITTEYKEQPRYGEPTYCVAELRNITNVLPPMDESNEKWTPEAEIKAYKDKYPAFANDKYNFYANRERF